MKRLCILALAACGGSGEHSNATPADAIESQGNVTVIVTERGKPVGGVPVLFLSTTEAAFSAVTSDDGSCGKNLMAGGSVTVLLPKQRFGTDRLMTFTDVEMGDVLRLDLAPLGPRTTELVVTADDAAQPGPYYLYTTCGGEEPFSLTPGTKTTVAIECAEPTADLLVVRIDPETLAPLRSAFVANATPGVEQNLTTFSDIQNLGVMYAGFGAYEHVSTTQLVMSEHGRLFESFTGGNPQMQMTTPIPPIARPTNAGMRSVLASTAAPLAGEVDQQVIYTPTDITDAAMTISMATRLPPLLDQSTTGTGNPIVGVFADNKLVWREGTGTAAADLARARVRFSRDDIPVGYAWTWEIVAKRSTAPEIVFPQLSTPAFERFAPIATDLATVEDLMNVKLPDGFTRSVRENSFVDVNKFISPDLGKPMVVQRPWFGFL
jgi:hypothetical protein